MTTLCDTADCLTSGPTFCRYRSKYASDVSSRKINAMWLSQHVFSLSNSLKKEVLQDAWFLSPAWFLKTFGYCSIG